MRKTSKFLLQIKK